MRLEGKRAVVTGAASGIGRATAQALAAAGARVFVADVDEAGGEQTCGAVRQTGGEADFVLLDVTEDASIAALADAVLGRGAAPDVVVNAAGWDRVEPFVDNSVEFMERVVRLNLLGTVKVAKAFLPAMIDAGAGAIVNVASDAGRVGSSGETVYAGAKGGIIAFTKSLAREMAPHDIRVNCVCPGPTDTPLFRSLPEKLQAALTRAIPFRRIARPEEIADAILFFASPRSTFITGQVLSVSGGLTMAG
ncbi:MAG: SDR family oxidoreductase [Myxococcales bacterium]|nr:SDR family oxidoreductase [Myxococcales bacterium]